MTGDITGFVAAVVVPLFDLVGLGDIITGLVIFIIGWVAFRKITGGGS